MFFRFLWLAVIGIAVAERRSTKMANIKLESKDGFDHTGCPSFNAFYYSGAISSPFYPNNYPNNVRCYYFLRAEFGKVLRFNFTDFDLESCCDYVTIYDGQDDSSPILLQIGGEGGSNNTKPSGLYYSSNQFALLTFTSDPVVTRRGFQMTFDSVHTASPCNRDMVLVINNLGSMKTEENFMKQLDFIANHLVPTWTIGEDKIRVIANLQMDLNGGVIYQYQLMPSNREVRDTVMRMSQYSYNVLNNTDNDFECMFRYAEEEQTTDPEGDGEREGIAKVAILFIAQNPRDNSDFSTAHYFAHKLRAQEDTKVITVAMGPNLDVKKIGSLSYGEGFYFGADWDQLPSLVDPINRAICQYGPSQCGV